MVWTDNRLAVKQTLLKSIRNIESIRITREQATATRAPSLAQLNYRPSAVPAPKQKPTLYSELLRRVSDTRAAADSTEELERIAEERRKCEEALAAAQCQLELARAKLESAESWSDKAVAAATEENRKREQAAAAGEQVDGKENKELAQEAETAAAAVVNAGVEIRVAKKKVDAMQAAVAKSLEMEQKLRRVCRAAVNVVMGKTAMRKHGALPLSKEFDSALY